MEQIVVSIHEVINAILADIDKKGNRAAAARVRKATLKLEKLGKDYRKASLAAEKEA